MLEQTKGRTWEEHVASHWLNWQQVGNMARYNKSFFERQSFSVTDDKNEASAELCRFTTVTVGDT